MRIALDAMGGDFAPDSIVQGAILASQDLPEDAEIVLIGQEDLVRECLQKHRSTSSRISIVAASQVIQMGEHPTKALTQKPDSSISKGYQLLKSKEIDAFCSAGNTGAMLVGAMFSVKAVEGVLRPAIVGFVPKVNGSTGIFLDVGANAECKPEVLEQFGELGSIYAENVLGIANPKVGLMNLGEEEGKGTVILQAAHQLLKKNENLNFIGNIEGRDLFNHKADVIVCDGFIGNVILKLSESIYDILLSKNIADPYFDKFNYEAVGGSPILGINGNAIIGHGVSSPTATCNMLHLAYQMAKSGITEQIQKKFQCLIAHYEPRNLTMSKISAAITGVSGYVPDYILTNQELETMVETNDEWIVTRTGIKERRILKEEGQGTSFIINHAVRDLLKKTNTRPEEVELIIVATTTPDMVFPATANLVANETNLVNAFGYDLQAACSGFLFALSSGAKYIESGRYKKVIVAGADKMSSIINYEDRTTCIIFGDGGGAVMLEPNNEGLGIIDEVLKSDGSGAPFLHMKAGGSRRPASHETVANKEHYAYQEGTTVFKFAVKGMADVAAEVMERNQLTGNDVAWLVPHQANKRIIDATSSRMNIGQDKVMINIDRYGNTTSGTLPLCLWDYENKLKKGDNVILAAFGGGFTWGSIYLKWAYDS